VSSHYWMRKFPLLFLNASILSVVPRLSPHFQDLITQQASEPLSTYLPIHSLTYLYIYHLSAKLTSIHPPMHSPTHQLTHPPSYPPMQPPIHSPIHPPTCPPIPPTHPCSHLFTSQSICLSMHPSTRPLICSPIYPSTYLTTTKTLDTFLCVRYRPGHFSV
jgi:hypothetical protein